MKCIEIGFFISCCIGAYIIGSIPVGYIVARIAGIEDIRSYGSGNIGATNVARTLGAGYFVPVFVLDFLKAYGTVAFVAYMFPQLPFFYGAALAYLVGNGCSLFLQGTGGKGVAATVGIIAAYSPLLVLLTATSWGIVFALTRTVGIASVGAALAMPFCAACIGLPWHGLLFIASISAWILVRHNDNIKNYLAQS